MHRFGGHFRRNEPIVFYIALVLGGADSSPEPKAGTLGDGLFHA